MSKEIKAPKAKARKLFKVNYHFDGNGTCEVHAKTAEEAEEKFREGLFNPADDKEWGENYFVESVERVCGICNSPEDDDGRCNCTNDDSK